MLKRSEHVAISVSKDRFQEAISFYKNLFDAQEVDKTENSIGLRGSNFTLWITHDAPGSIMQEWVPQNPDGAREKFLAAGCKLVDFSGKPYTEHGFFVEDPYGLRYHVYTAKDNFHATMFPNS